MTAPAPQACALLFDIDGTLTDSTYHHALAWHRAFHGLGVAVPLFRIHRTVGMGGDKLVAHVAGDEVEARLGDRLRSDWRDHYVELKGDVRPLPGAAELVHRAAQAGFRVALASSGEPEFAAEAVDLLEIGHDVEVVTTAEDVGGSKPDPDLVGETIARLDGVSHALLTGDTPYDVEAARRAGIGCVALRSGGYSEAELADAGALLVVDLPEDLLDLDWAERCLPLGQGRVRRDT
jgi:HAD superfamily hydrolase (TIGR01549 family)